MGWSEGYYMVRRRSRNDEDVVIKHLHDLWEDVAFYEAWLATESPELAWSYNQLIEQIKSSVRPLIIAAWATDPQPMSEELPDDEQRPECLPEVIRARKQYLDDVRRHMSAWPLSRRDLNRRYHSNAERSRRG